MLNFRFITSILMVVSFYSCGQKPETQKDQPPGLRNYTAPIKEETPLYLIGEWESCTLSEDKQNSIHYKINIGSGLEIKETIYDDKYCQLIESTKVSSTISYFYFDYLNETLKAKIQEQKIYFFDKKTVNQMNEIAYCGFTDWEVKEAKEILGVFCTGLKKISKYDYFEFKTNLESNILYFNAKPLARKLSYDSYSTQRSITLNNPTSSEVVPEKYNSNVMVVFPPRVDEFEVEVKTHFGTNLEQCDDVLDSYSDSKNRLEKMKIIKDEIKEIENEISNLNLQISAVSESFLEFIKINNLVTFDEVSRKIIDNEDLLASFKEDLKNCKENCEEAKKKIQALQEDIDNLYKIKSDIQITWSQKRAYNRFISEIESIEDDIQDNINDINKKEIEIKKRLDQYKKVFLKYSSIIGPLSHIYFKSSWEENLKKLIKVNPKLKFKFAKIGKTSLEYRIKGLPLYPAAGSIMGLPLNGAKEPFKGRIIMEEYPKFIFGRVKISLLAACPAYRPEDYNLVLERPHTLKFEAILDY